MRDLCYGMALRTACGGKSLTDCMAKRSAIFPSTGFESLLREAEQTGAKGDEDEAGHVMNPKALHDV